MRIGLAQMDMVWEKKEENFQKSLSFLEEAKLRQVDLVVFPEMSMTGFSMHTDRIGETDEENQKEIAVSANQVQMAEVAYKGLETLAFFQKQAVKYGLHIGIGYVEKAVPKSYNRFAILDPQGRILTDYAKIHPFSYGKEAEYYQGGQELSCCQVKEFVTAPLICYDLRFPEIFQILSKKAQLILVPANWPASRQEHFELLLRARALENQCFVAGINRTGSGGNLVYKGGSLVADPFGNILAQADDGEQLLIADLDLDTAERYREDFPVKKDRRSGLYVVLSNKNV